MPPTSRLGRSWERIKVGHGWLLILSCLLVFTTKNLYNIAFGLMAILGLLDLGRLRTRLNDPGMKVLGGF